MKVCIVYTPRSKAVQAKNDNTQPYLNNEHSMTNIHIAIIIMHKLGIGVLCGSGWHGCRVHKLHVASLVLGKLTGHSRFHFCIPTLSLAVSMFIYLFIRLLFIYGVFCYFERIFVQTKDHRVFIGSQHKFKGCHEW